MKFERIDDMQRSVLDALGEGLVVQDASGRIAYANPAAEQILGLDADEMLGLTSKDARWVVVGASNARSRTRRRSSSSTTGCPARTASPWPGASVPPRPTSA
jgi:PAS domain S-box-containing protein